jgi:biotin transporter BioY
MWGVFAHVTNISAPTLLYVIAVPVLTAISIFALDRGMRSMHVRHTNFALAVVSLFLILDGANIFSFGVFWLHSFTGKSWSWTLGAGFTPFILGEALKIAIAGTSLPLVWRKIQK